MFRTDFVLWVFVLSIVSICVTTFDDVSADDLAKDDPAKGNLTPAMIRERIERTPRQVAESLTKHYGDQLEKVMYQPALSLVARLRLGELTGDESHLIAVEQIVREYADGSKRSLPEKFNGSQLAGHLVFAELARLTDDERYVDLVRRAADKAFEDDGRLREAMPTHLEMSDAVFMACPILTAAGRLTGDDRYFTMAGRHLVFMQRHCLRDDGLYRHWPQCEAAWGRGNGFPALALALCLSDLQAVRQHAVDQPSEAVARLQQTMQTALRDHLRAMARHQADSGMWRQVVDDSVSYEELTVTCMTTYAIARGTRQGWLDREEYWPLAVRAWEGIKLHVGTEGDLTAVCTGTGKKKTLQDYRDRPAIDGNDVRGGAMALMAAVEMAAVEKAAAQ